ncbi:hypothetical protein B4134_3876 [Bacillus safensis]|nr:hypothetical protein B4134_3876 [Bacillus safensis]
MSAISLHLSLLTSLNLLYKKTAMKGNAQNKESLSIVHPILF